MNTYDLSKYIKLIGVLSNLSEVKLDLFTNYKGLTKIRKLIDSLHLLLIRGPQHFDVNAKVLAYGCGRDRALWYLPWLPVQTSSLDLTLESRLNHSRDISYDMLKGLSVANNLEVLRINRVSLPGVRDVIHDYNDRMNRYRSGSLFAKRSEQVQEDLSVTALSKLRRLETWEPLLFDPAEVTMADLPALKELEVILDFANEENAAHYAPGPLEPVWTWLQREPNKCFRLHRVRTNWALRDLVDYLASDAARDLQELEVFFAERIPSEEMEGLRLGRLGWWEDDVGERFVTDALSKVCGHLKTLTLMPIEWNRAPFIYMKAEDEDRENLVVPIWLQQLEEWTLLRTGVDFVFQSIQMFTGFMVYNERDKEVTDFSKIFRTFPQASELNLYILYHVCVETNSTEVVGNTIFQLAEAAMSAHVMETQQQNGRLMLRVMSIAKDICMDKAKKYYFSKYGLRCYTGGNEDTKFDVTWDFVI